MATDIDKYIADFPPEIQAILEKIRSTIRKAAPDAAEAFKYGMPTFTLQGNLVCFAAWKRHIGFYPRATGNKKLDQELGAYAGGKGTIKFPLGRPIPYGLIGRWVKARVKINREKAQARSARRSSRSRR